MTGPDEHFEGSPPTISTSSPRPCKAGRTAGIRRQAQRSGGAAVGELDLVNLGNLSLSGPDQAGIALSQRYFSSAPSSRRSPPNRARCCCRASGSPPCRVMWTRPPSSATTRIWCWSTTLQRGGLRCGLLRREPLLLSDPHPALPQQRALRQDPAAQPGAARHRGGRLSLCGLGRQPRLLALLNHALAG